MKRHTLYSIFFALLAGSLFTACHKSDQLEFTDAPGVYFFTDSLLYTQDSLTYSFATQESDVTKDTIAIPLKLLGLTADHDRTIAVKAVDSETTAVAGTHYNLLPAVIKAGQYKDSLYIEVIKTPDLATKEVRLELQITDGGDLKPGAIEKTTYLVKINNILSKPDNWDNLLVLFFGDYSQAKHRFIIDVTGYSTYEFYVPGTTTTDFQFYLYLKQILRDALQKEGPIYDESGNPISFPA